MTDQIHETDLPLLAKLIRAHLRSKLRGQTRLTFFLAHKFKELQALPITINDRAPIYVDLRFGISHTWLKGSPWTTCPVEQDEQSVVSRFVREGNVVFDIGANLGLYTTLLSRLVGSNGKVYAFEPNHDLLPTLRKTIDGLSNTTLFPCGLSDEIGEANLYVPNDHSMGSLADYTSSKELDSWREQIGLEKAKKVTCKLDSIDNLVDSKTISPPDFIKCDVEGAELMVFKGGSKTLNRINAPIILFEALEDCTSGFALPRLAALDFLRTLPLANYQFLEISEGGRLEKLKESNTGPNFLAVPAAKAHELPELRDG